MKTNFAAIIVVVAFFLTGFTASAVPVPPAGQSPASAAATSGHGGSPSAGAGSGTQDSKGQHSAVKSAETVAAEYSKYETSNPILLEALSKLEQGYVDALKGDQATDSLGDTEVLKSQQKIAGLLRLQSSLQGSKNLVALRGNAPQVLKDASFVTVIADWWGEPTHQKEPKKARYMLRTFAEVEQRLVAELGKLHNEMKSKLSMESKAHGTESLKARL